MKKDIEISKGNLPYNEQLKCIAQRLEMTEIQALETIIHEIYESGVTYSELKAAVILILDNIYDECVEYDSDGNILSDE